MQLADAKVSTARNTIMGVYPTRDGRWSYLHAISPIIVQPRHAARRQHQGDPIARHDIPLERAGEQIQQLGAARLT
jgi:hypothetical protein